MHFEIGEAGVQAAVEELALETKLIVLALVGLQRLAVTVLVYGIFQ